jgi:hypothetical protein
LVVVVVVVKRAAAASASCLAAMVAACSMNCASFELTTAAPMKRALRPAQIAAG